MTIDISQRKLVISRDREELEINYRRTFENVLRTKYLLRTLVGCFISVVQYFHEFFHLLLLLLLLLSVVSVFRNCSLLTKLSKKHTHLIKPIRLRNVC